MLRKTSSHNLTSKDPIKVLNLPGLFTVNVKEEVNPSAQSKGLSRFLSSKSNTLMFVASSDKSA